MGLLDFQMPGMDTAEGQGLLAASLSLMGAQKMPGQRGAFGSALADAGRQYMGSSIAAKEAAMKQKYMQSQLDENTSQIEARRLAGIKDARTQERMDKWLNGDGNPQAVSVGAFSPSVDGYGPTMPMYAPQAQATGVQGGVKEYARSIGIPDQVIEADLATNGGKGLAEMLFKRGAPDMQVTNGYAYDKNKVGAGYLPSLSTSQDGKTSMVQIGQDGMPVVSAPRGAMETFGGYQGAQAAFKPIKVFNPATGREEYSNEGAVVRGQPAQGGAQPGYGSEPAMKTTVAGPMGADPAAIQREIRATQTSLTQSMDEPSRAMLRAHLADLQKQAQQPGVAQSGNFAAGPSATETAIADANKTRMVDSSKAGTARIMTGYDGAQSAVEMITSNIEARKSLAGGSFQGTGAETKLAISKALQGIGFDVAPDKVANTDYLQSTLGQGILNKAKTLGANPTDNDARIIRSIVGSIGTDPQALNKLLDHQDVMANRSIDQHNKNYGDAKGRGFDAGFDLSVKAPAANTNKPKPVQTFDSKPPAQNYKGKTATGPDGRRYQSDGMIWKEVK